MRNEIAKVSSSFNPSYWRTVYKEKRFPDEYWNALSSSGLFGMLIEKRCGGLEKTPLDLTLAVMETAEKYAGLGSYLFLSGALVSTFFSKHGTEKQKEELLPKLAKGQVKISIALTEESSGFDSSSIQTFAKKSPKGGFEIKGSKTFVNNVDRADYLLLFARTTPLKDSEKKSMGVTMFLVDANNPAIHPRRLEKIGWNFINNFSMEIDELNAPEESIVGEMDRAWYNAVESFNLDRIMTSASLIGTGRLALTQASEYASKRNVFGKPIGSNQGVQFPMADAVAQLLSAEAMTLKSASIATNGGNYMNEANYSLQCSETAATSATERAMQTLGGHGYYEEYDVARYWIDVRAHKVHPISEELLLATIAERSLRLPKSY